MRIWHKIKTWDLRVSASFSLAIHFFFIFSASILFSGAEVREPAVRFVTVSVHPVEEESKAIPVEKKTMPKVAPSLPVRKPAQTREQREPVETIQHFVPALPSRPVVVPSQPAPSPAEEKEANFKEPQPKPPEPITRKEIQLPLPLPVQTIEREVPAEAPKPNPPHRKETVHEEHKPKPIESIPKREIQTPIPLPVQTVEREVPAEAPRPNPPRHEEEKKGKEPESRTMVAALITDPNLMKEERLSLPLSSPPPEPMRGNTPSSAASGNKPSGTTPGEGAGKRGGGGGGGRQEGGSGNGSAPGGSPILWKGFGEGAGTGQQGPPGGGALSASLSNSGSGSGSGTGSGSGSGSMSGSGSGSGSQAAPGSGSGPGTGSQAGLGPGTGSGVQAGSGTGSVQGDVPAGNSRKATGLWGKLFPSPGETGGGSPRYAENPKPPYPPEARAKGYHGEVLLRVEVLSNGRVGQIEIKRSSGYDVLDQSALSTVKQWKFIPAKKGENAISLWVNIPIKFQLQ